MWLGEPAPTQTRLWARRAWSTKTRSTRGSGKGATAPAAKPVALSTCSGEAIRARGAPATGDEHNDPAAVAVEDEGLHDLAELATRGSRGVHRCGRPGCELLDPRFRTRLPQEDGDTLDGFGPCTNHVRRVSETFRPPPPLYSRQMKSEELRIAKTESRFREVNERIAETAK